MIAHGWMKDFIKTLDLDDDKRAVLERYRVEQAQKDESCDPVRLARLAEQRSYQAETKVDILKETVSKMEDRILVTVEEIITALLAK